MENRRHELYIVFAFLALVHLLYYPAWNAGFVTDFTGLLWRLDGSSAAGIFNSFGFPALQPVLNAFLFLFCKAFGLHPLPWYLAFTSMHVLNGWLAYRFGAAVLRGYGMRMPRLAALAGALFFLLSPYQSEVLTWRVCFNFLLSSFLVLSILYSSYSWMREGRRGQLWAVHGLFVLALFTFELALAVPLACLVLLLLYPPTLRNRLGLRLQLLRLSAPQFALTLGYFLLNRLILGAWVGHYGPAVHLRFRLGEILANYYRYGFKLLAFSRYWPHPCKEGLSGKLQEPLLFYPLAIVSVLALVYALARFRRWRGEGQAALLFLLLFILALAPAVNLYFNYLLYIENDRYGYLASAFFFLGLSALLSVLPRWLFLLLVICYIGLSAFFLRRTNLYWRQSTALYYGLMDSFRWYDAPAVYLLNLPDNYQGAVLFRDFSGQGEAFRDALKYIKKAPYEGAIHEVAQYNLATPADGVTVRRDSAMHYTVEFNQWGNWWWRRGIGMGPGYQANTYSVDSKGHFYHLQLDTIEPGAVLLYQVKGEWREVE